MIRLMLRGLVGLLLLTSSISAEDLVLRRVLWSVVTTETADVSFAPDSDLLLINDHDGIRVLDPQTGRAAWGNGDPQDAGFVLQWEPSRPNQKTSQRELLSGVWINQNWIGLVDGAHLGTRFIPFQLVSLEMSAEGRLAWNHPAHELVAEPDWNFASAPILLSDAVAIVVQREAAHRILILNLQGELLTMVPLPSLTSRPAPVVITLSTTGSDLFLCCGETLLAFQWDGKRLSTRPRGPASDSNGDFGSPVPTALCLTSEMVICLRDRSFECRERATGAIRFRLELPAAANSLLDAGDGIVLVSGQNLTAIELETGKTLWEIAPLREADQGVGRAALVEGVLFWPTRDEIVKIDPRTGQLKQQIPLRALTGVGGGDLIPGPGILLVREPGRLTALELVAEDGADQSQ